MSERPNIFRYEDYRLYLADLYRHLKARQRGFSHRYFSKRAGFRSPNMLQLVIEGKRNVTARTVGKFIRGLALNQQESEFFVSLVEYGQAASPEEKSRAFRRMAKSRRFREIHELHREVFRFYTQWFHIVLREMIQLDGFVADPGWIAQNILPRISKEQAARALKLLLKLNLVKKSADPKLIERTDPIIATAPEVKSLAVMNFHQSMINLAAQSLSTVSAEERDITSATLGIRQSELPRIKKKIEAFRKSLLAESEAGEQKPDRIYQLNIQLFPVTQRIGDDA